MHVVFCKNSRGTMVVAVFVFLLTERESMCISLSLAECA